MIDDLSRSLSCLPAFIFCRYGHTKIINEDHKITSNIVVAKLYLRNPRQTGIVTFRARQIETNRIPLEGIIRIFWVAFNEFLCYHHALNGLVRSCLQSHRCPLPNLPRDCLKFFHSPSIFREVDPAQSSEVTLQKKLRNISPMSRSAI